jgi:hypothetical protein
MDQNADWFMKDLSAERKFESDTKSSNVRGSHAKLTTLTRQRPDQREDRPAGRAQDANRKVRRGIKVDKGGKRVLRAVFMYSNAYGPDGR